MMTVNNNFDLRMVSWNEYADALTAIRHQVFVTEQNVPIDEEVDDFDRAVATQHLLVYLDHKPVACARLLSSGQIGRMAVLVEHRGCGIGRIMLRSLLQRRLADVGDNLNPPFYTHNFTPLASTAKPGLSKPATYLWMPASPTAI
jgi:Predicted acyltransferase